MASEVSAGGIVFKQDPELQFLMILDGYGRWTFPKGGVEAGETPAQAAVREIEEETGKIVNAECTLATSLARDFFRRLVVGCGLETEFASIVRTLESRYQGSAQKALVSALKGVLEKYQSYHRNG